MKRVVKLEVEGKLFDDEKTAIKYIENKQYDIISKISDRMAYHSTFKIRGLFMNDDNIKGSIKEFLRLENLKNIEEI